MGILRVAGQRATAADQNQYYGFADTSTTTVTAATAQNLTTPYNIPAGEPVVGSTYEIRFGGSGTWGATQQSLAFTLGVGGTALFSGSVVLGAQAFAASAAFRFSGLATIVWNQIGASGNVLGTLMVNLSETANAVQPPGTVNQANLQAAATYGLADSSPSASAAIDATAAQAFVVKVAWGATTGAPTLTNRLTVWKKTA